MARRDRPPCEALKAARAVGRALSEALGEDLVAVYLHGSAVLGGFRWERSDLDVLALSRGALPDGHLERIVEALMGLPFPANGLEFSLMKADEAAQPEFPAPRYELHLTTARRDRAAKVVDGRRGPETAISSSIWPFAGRAVLRWVRLHGALEYLVLTSARAWLFAEEHRLASKVGAGRWAAKRYPEPDVIEAALARQRGADIPVSQDAAERLASHVERLTAPAEI